MSKKKSLKKTSFFKDKIYLTEKLFIGCLMMTLEQLLQLMVQKRASDLHLKAGSQPIIRQNGCLYLLEKNLPFLTEEDIQNIINPLINSDLKSAYKQNKNIDFSTHFPNIGRVRFCVFSQKGTTRLVGRLISNKIRSFEELKLPPIFNQMGSYKNGLILITGATGSGKSTTAASLINYINKNHSYHIITIEDPIEYIIEDYQSCITQREYLLDFKSPNEAFKGSLRQDPDVIFFGELRDEEGVKTALQAADSGHLVISTFHVSTVLEVFDRFLSFFKNSEEQKNIRLQLINCLRAIVGQKLVPALDGSLRPILEIFLNTLSMKQAFLKEKPLSEIYDMMEKSFKTRGMQSFDQHIIQLIQENIISEEVGIKYAFQPENVRMTCQGILSTNTSVLGSTESSFDLDAFKTLQIKKERKSS